MTNISKKEIKVRIRKKLEDMNIDADLKLKGKLSLQQGVGKSPKYSKYSMTRITNQRGAFGSPGWKKGLSAGIYETFTMTNHERCLRNRRIKEAKQIAAGKSK